MKNSKLIYNVLSFLFLLFTIVFFLMGIGSCKEEIRTVNYQEQLAPPVQYKTANHLWSFDTESDAYIFSELDTTYENYSYEWISSDQVALSLYAIVQSDLSVLEIDPVIMDTLFFRSCLDDGFRVEWKGEGLVLEEL